MWTKCMAKAQDITKQEDRIHISSSPPSPYSDK